MRRRIILIFASFRSRILDLIGSRVLGPQRKPTLYIRNGALYDNASKKVILRGINLPLLDDWTFPGADTIAELDLTGPYAVPIQWYVNYGNPDRPAYHVVQPSCLLD